MSGELTEQDRCSESSFQGHSLPEYWEVADNQHSCK